MDWENSSEVIPRARQGDAEEDEGVAARGVTLQPQDPSGLPGSRSGHGLCHVVFGWKSPSP